MKSRYGLWVLSVCWIGLAGCANWQNRAGSMQSPGSAASLSPASSLANGPMIQGPGTSFGEPPPPVPPGAERAALAPLDNPAPQKLNLSDSDDSASGPSGKMYNLDGAHSSPHVEQVAKVRNESPKNSTISKLATKASSEKKSVVVASESNKDTARDKPATRGSSTISRLSRDAAKDDTKEARLAPAKSAPVATVTADALPVPSTAKAAPPISSPEPAVDTTLLAQPVRKGAAESSKSSDGPQSSVMPGNTNLFKTKGKPAIYPVSNPAVPEPVNIIEFS